MAKSASSPRVSEVFLEKWGGNRGRRSRLAQLGGGWGWRLSCFAGGCWWLHARDRTLIVSNFIGRSSYLQQNNRK